MLISEDANVYISLSHPSKFFNLSMLSFQIFRICYWVWHCLNVSMTPFCSYRKRASPLPKDDHSGGVKDCLLANSSDPVEMRRLNYQTPGNTPYTICTIDTHYQSARAPCVLYHMHAYTFPLTQCVIFELITICSMHGKIQSLPCIHNACTLSHCSISSESCSVTLMLFFLYTNPRQHMPPNVSFSINWMRIHAHMRHTATEVTERLCNQYDLLLSYISSNLHSPPTKAIKTQHMREEALSVITLNLKAR